VDTVTNFIRRLKIAWRFTLNFPYTPLPNDFWSVENAKELSNFLTGDTGSKLRFLLRNKINDTASRAIIDTSEHSKHLCGYAAGVRGTVAEIDQLLDLANTRDFIGVDEEEAKLLAERENLT
jgi:hypothetical protein